MQDELLHSLQWLMHSQRAGMGIQGNRAMQRHWELQLHQGSGQELTVSFRCGTKCPRECGISGSQLLLSHNGSLLANMN